MSNFNSAAGVEKRFLVCTVPVLMISIVIFFLLLKYAYHLDHYSCFLFKCELEHDLFYVDNTEQVRGVLLGHA